MPSSTLRHLGNQPGQPVMQPAFRPSYRPVPPLIGPGSYCALGEFLSGIKAGSYASSTYLAASRVIAYPFELNEHFVVRKVWWMNGTTATTDSADVGVYDESGATLLVSGGSTAIATANIVQEKDCTDTLLIPGRYWCAYVQGGTTATPIAIASTGALLRAGGCAQQAGSGSTLGSTFTPAAVAAGGAILPLFGIASRTQVA